MVDTPDIEEIARTIADRFQPRRIVLFGSHARGEATDESDIDLFVEMETGKKPPERAIEMSAIFGLRRWPLDVIVYTPDEVTQLREVEGTLLAAIEAEGETLYERP